MADRYMGSAKRLNLNHNESKYREETPTAFCISFAGSPNSPKDESTSTHTLETELGVQVCKLSELASSCDNDNDNDLERSRNTTEPTRI